MHKSWLKYVILLLMSVLTISIYLIYNQFFGVSITPEGGKATLLIPEDATFRQAMDSVEANLIIKNKKILEWVAEKKKYQKLVKPGKYVIDRSLSYNELINILRGGKQTPVRITFINLRTLNDIA
ncbi:MAG TPA: aminodeoxychorismate lyase, partial [Bacteroidales bacterium]|nr:aminodeoxychorismate lyase [Bacteroidales bacterium]